MFLQYFKLLSKKTSYFSHCDEYNVIGFDCEWVSYGKDRHPIALLQLESHRGYCALIRLCHLRKVPREVRVSCSNDFKRNNKTNRGDLTSSSLTGNP